MWSDAATLRTAGPDRSGFWCSVFPLLGGRPPLGGWSRTIMEANSAADNLPLLQSLRAQQNQKASRGLLKFSPMVAIIKTKMVRMKKIKKLRINKPSKKVTKVKRESQAVSPVPLSLNPILCRSAVESRSGGRQKIIRSEDVICYRWTGTLPTLALPPQSSLGGRRHQSVSSPSRLNIARWQPCIDIERNTSLLCSYPPPCAGRGGRSRCPWLRPSIPPALTWPLDIPSSGIIMITEPVSSCGGQHPGLAGTRCHTGTQTA